MILQLTVHLIHVESIIQVFLETDYVLQAFPCLPLVHLRLQPAFLLEDLKAALAPKELGDKEIALVAALAERVEDLVVDE